MHAGLSTKAQGFGVRARVLDSFSALTFSTALSPFSLFSLPFPLIDPIALQMGPIVVRWYALAYVFGVLLGWWWCCRALRLHGSGSAWKTADLHDFLSWAILGVLLGGRLGYVVFYHLSLYVADPVRILFLWEGGMSAHGGILGLAFATWLFSRRRRKPFLELIDIICLGAPIGLFLGRLANFVNGELYGRATDVSWAMIFPQGGLSTLRHPSQLYQAGLEGIVLFLLLWALVRNRGMRRPGVISGSFLVGYGVCRMFVEFFRAPDAHIGFVVAGHMTLGQLLSLPMLLVGGYLLFHARSGLSR